MPGRRIPGDSRRNQGRTALRRDEFENRIFRVCRVTFEIDAGVEVLQKPPREHYYVDMRSLKTAARSGHPPGLDRLEGTTAVEVRLQPAKAVESAGLARARIER